MRRALTLLLTLGLSSPAVAGDWTSWRGPFQDGSSDETGLVDSWSPDGTNLLWTLDLPGRGTPVIHDGRAYVWGYQGERDALSEVLVAVDVASGKEIWRRTFRDFVSDIIYSRYSIGAPTVDPTTGRVYVQSSAGLLMAFERDGTPVWEVSMMEAFGRLTFPNGRTGTPIIVGDRVLVHGITANWGGEGPARDRFYAFDKATGTAIWGSTPGIRPRDSSFSTPLVLPDASGERLIAYAGTGCGNVVAIDAMTGEPVWRAPVSAGGVNISVVVADGKLVVTHAKENLDTTETGRMVALDLSAQPGPPTDGKSPVLQAELWRNDLSALSSSPLVVDGVIYQVTMTGELHAVDLDTGSILWTLKLGPDQLHASPTYADGKLYIPLHDGSFHIVKVGRDAGTILSSVQLDGSALGAPAISDGRIYVHTTSRLYVFGVPKASPTPVVEAPAWSKGEAVAARVRPSELLLRPSERADLAVELLDSHGQVVDTVAPESVETFIPPTAKVKSTMRASWTDGVLVADVDAGQSAGAFKVTAKGLSATTRGRTVAGLGYAEDFDATELQEDDGTFAYPPLAWIGARFKWEVRQVGETKALAKTLDRMLFQRSTVFIGHPDERAYELSVDVMSDGDRRLVSAGGVINQRYKIALKGNQRVLEVSSNQERLKESVPFTMKPGTWYRLRTQVTVEPDGTAVVLAKAWPRDEAEPADWTITVRHADGHTHGAPGLYGFTPQNLHRVYLDNVSITRIPGEAP